MTKKTLYDHRSVFGRVISPQFGHLDLGAVVLMDVQKIALPTSPYQARLSLMIVKTPYGEAQMYGLTESVEGHFSSGRATIYIAFFWVPVLAPNNRGPSALVLTTHLLLSSRDIL